MAFENSELSTNQDPRKYSLYQTYQAQYAEVLKHERIESEKAGHDIGFDQALIDWMLKHRADWLKAHPVSAWNRHCID